MTAASLSLSVPFTAVSTWPSCAVPLIDAAVVKASVMSLTAAVAALVEVVVGPPSRVGRRLDDPQHMRLVGLGHRVGRGGRAD